MIKDEYIDKYGNDSLRHLKIASEAGNDFFVTNNKGMIKDREELEKKYGLKIKTAKEMLIEMAKKKDE